jgi:cytochrome P450
MGIMRQNPMTPAGAAPGCPVDEDFDPLAPEFLADPYTVMARLPDGRKPVFFAPSIGYYVVTSYGAIQQAFGDPTTYSAAVAQAPLAPLTPEAQQILLAGGHKPQPSMVSLDEPEHARLRRPAARAFSMKRVTAMIPAIEATTARLLDAVDGSEEFDVVGALAFPLPANIVFSLMGVPAGDFAQLKQWCGYRAALAWGRPAPEDQVEIATSMAAYRKYLRDLVDAKTRAPADDLTSDLIGIHREAPERLTLDEIASILFSLSFAGHETTTGLIGNTVRRLLEDPGRWTEIVARPDLIPGAIDETLRYDPSVPVWRRITTRPVTLAGVELPAGARLFLWLAAAGRDEEAFDRPAEFDMGRTDADHHLAFGKGLHYCLGANLGKLEAQIAVAELARRFPGLRLAPDQQLTFHPNISFRGPQVLLVRTHP